MKRLGKTKKTPRKFEVITFMDYNGEECSLQASSLAMYTQPGSSAIWLGCNKPPDLIRGEHVSPRMHLTLEHVKALVNHLQSWIRTGSFVIRKTNVLAKYVSGGNTGK